MPQYLDFHVGASVLAELMTSNRSGGQRRSTSYDIFWEFIGAPRKLLFTKDTGVLSQPLTQPELDVDTKSDFTHARRSIAAICKSAEEILEIYSSAFAGGGGGFETVEINLRTNKYGRGKLTITQDGNGYNIRMEIGNGHNRVPGARPSATFVRNYHVETEAVILSPLGTALKVLSQENNQMLSELENESTRDLSQER